MQHGRSDCDGSLDTLLLRSTSHQRFNSIFIVCAVVLMSLTVCINGASEGYVEPDEHGPFDCTRLMLKGAKQIMKVLSACGREVKATTSNNKEYADKMGCVLKCVMRKARMVNEQYLLTDATLKDLIDRFSPNAFMANEVFEYMNTYCAKSASKLDPNEEKCMTYASYVSCLQASFEGFMTTSKYCIKKPKKTED